MYLTASAHSINFVLLMLYDMFYTMGQCLSVHVSDCDLVALMLFVPVHLVPAVHNNLLSN